MKILKYILFPVFFLISIFSLYSQSPSTINLNTYYAYPFSAAGCYQPLSGIADRNLADFSINEISGELRLPLKKLPILQLLVRGGLITYTFLGDIEETHQDWTHSHVFVGPGVGFITRISREFEVGADLFAGASQSYFTELSLGDETETMGQLNIIAGASARLALNPSYNFSISANPSLRFIYGLGNLHTYDGFTFGVGFSGTYRFGQDPDRAQSTIRAIRFDNIVLPGLFAAMQSYYAEEEAGSFTVTNIEKFPLEGLEISFLQPGFMDSPTPLDCGGALQPGESLTVPIRTVFNNEVFSTQGITPLTGELIARYTARGRQVEQRQSVSYELYDRNALTWDDDRKVAAFITPSDSAIRNYASFIRRAHREYTNEYLSANLQFAMQAFNALTELGLIYQVDPTSPFTQVQGDAMVVDSISLPRETLSRLTGDCDDLTVLYTTMLESVGIGTALVTTPGHIFCGLNTGLSPKDYALLHPDRNMMLEIDGELWILVETTMVGRRGFLEAWSTAMSEYREYDEDPGKRGFYRTSEAQQLFRPVALRETDLGLQYGDRDAMIGVFSEDMEQLASAVMEPYTREAKEKNTARAWNACGTAAARLGFYDQAEDAFNQALRIDREFLIARLNLGSLLFLREDLPRALEVFEEAEETIDSGDRISKTGSFKVYINLSKTHFGLKHFDEARTCYNRAREIDPESAVRYNYLGVSQETETGRAAEASTEPILFFEEELLDSTPPED